MCCHLAQPPIIPCSDHRQDCPSRVYQDWQAYITDASHAGAGVHRADAVKAWLVLQLSGTFRGLNTAEMPQWSLKGRCRWNDTSLGPISSGKKSGRLVSMLCMRFVSYVLLAVSKRPVPLASPHCRKRESTWAVASQRSYLGATSPCPVYLPSTAMSTGELALYAAGAFKASDWARLRLLFPFGVLNEEHPSAQTA